MPTEVDKPISSSNKRVIRFIFILERCEGVKARPDRCYGTGVRWLVFTNVYVALCGAALTAATYALLGLPIQIDAVVGLVFCCTLVIYNLDRLVEPHPGDTAHEQWVEQHRMLLWGLIAAGAIGAGACMLWLSTAARWSLFAAGAVAIAYCLPIVGRPASGQPYYRLKDLPGAKLPLIAVVWAYATAGLPMLQAGVSVDLSSSGVLIGRLLFLAAVALPFDVPDMQRDRLSGIATLPTRFGVNATRHIALLLAVAAATVALGHPYPMAWAVLMSCVATFTIIFALQPSRGVLYFMVALDGMLLLQAALLWITVGLS